MFILDRSNATLSFCSRCSFPAIFAVRKQYAGIIEVLGNLTGNSENQETGAIQNSCWARFEVSLCWSLIEHNTAERHFQTKDLNLDQCGVKSRAIERSQGSCPGRSLQGGAILRLVTIFLAVYLIIAPKNSTFESTEGRDFRSFEIFPVQASSLGLRPSKGAQHSLPCPGRS